MIKERVLESRRKRDGKEMKREKDVRVSGEREEREMEREGRVGKERK